MKKNNKGFMITEALIISTIVLAILVFMYAQFRTINKGFNQTFKYNTVEDIYKTNEIKKFIETDATNNMISLLNSSANGYLDITECNITTYNDVSFCKYLYEKLQIKSVLLLAEDVTNVVNGKMNNLETGTQNFLKYIKNNYTGNYHRIVVSYKDGTYATLRIDVLRDIYDFEYTGDVQTFTAPIDAYYQIELWGAQGGSYNAIGGYGAYAKGTIYLKKDTKLYVYVGGQGSYIGEIGGAGYNGGGNSGPTVSAGGGGATHVALVSGLLSELEKDKDSILVVAAGGGGTGCNTDKDCTDGGSGGGFIGSVNTTIFGGCLRNNKQCYGLGGTQTSGGLRGEYNIDANNFGNNGGFGFGGAGKNLQLNLGNGGGGGAGIYGGGGAAYNSGAGGASYIASSKLEKIGKVMYCYKCTESDEADTYTISTTNVLEAPTSEFAKIGNGYARITMLSE